jgi:transcriptional regulator with XRE-family HTH domain
MKKRSKLNERPRNARRADGSDAEVGHRVRSRRLECDLSQTELANRIGVSFQQVQKYEKGVNRITSGRLQEIANVLEVPIAFFFGLPANDTGPKRNQDGENLFRFVQTSAAIRIAKAHRKIKSRKARQLLVALTEEFAGREVEDRARETG